MPTRPDLIADWQTRLAAAEEGAGCASSPGWLQRARVRLYRFLLSLYGDGGWNADAPLNAIATAIACACRMSPRSSSISALSFDHAAGDWGAAGHAGT